MPNRPASIAQFSASGSDAANDPFSFDAAHIPHWMVGFGQQIWAHETAAEIALLAGRLHTTPAAGTASTSSTTVLSASTGTAIVSVSAAAPAQVAAAASPNLGTSSHGLTNILYPLNADGTADIRVSDINQGTALGDCYFLASLGEVAIQHPYGIQNMIAVNANGTETVTLYEDTNGSAVSWNTTAYKAVQITVTNSNFISGGVNGQSGQAVWNNEQVIWPQVLENAFAQLSGGYNSIANGGSPVLAIEALTGHAASYHAPSSMTAAVLGSDWSAGDLVVFDTPTYNNASDTNTTYALIGGHAYMFDGLTTSGGVTYVNLLNPWGDDQPDAVPVSQLSSVFAEVDVGTYTAPTTPPAISGAVASVASSDEAASTPFSGVTVTSIAGVTETATVKLSAAANGTLSDADGGSYNASTGTYTISGTAAAVTTALDALVFTPTAHQVAPGATETTRLSLTVSDTNGTATAATNVVATAATDAMTISGASTSGSTTDLAAIKPFSAVTVAEPDAGQTFTATVTLSTAANGSLASSAGGSFNASTGVWTFTGTTVATVNAAIDALTFTPTAHQVAPGATVSTTLALKISDTAGSSATASEKITVTASNQAMAVTGAPASGTTVKITDETTAAPFHGVTVNDPDYGRTVSATVTVSNTAYGTLSSAAGGSYNATFGFWTVSGTAAAVTAALDALTFTPKAHQFAPGTVKSLALSLSLADSAGTSSSSSTTVAITSATDPITLTGLANTASTTDTAGALKPLGTLTVGEPDYGQTLTATVTLSSTANGTLSNLGAGSLSSTGVYTVSGTAAAVTTALDALTYTPTAHQGVGGSTVQTSFALKVTDTAGATATASTALTVKESTLTVASGSTLTVAGTQNVAELLNNGTVAIKGATLDVTKLVDTASTGTFQLGGSATLDVASIAGSQATMSFIGSGNLLDIDASAAFGTKSGTSSYAGPTLSGFGAGDTIDLKNVSASGASLSYTPSTGLLQIMHGSTDLATLHFANATLGSGSFHAATDNAGGMFVTLS